jgi:tryptophan synthase beta chain
VSEFILPRVKVCGVQSFADIEAAFACELDAVGLVAWERSPRHVSAPDAAALVRRLPRSILPIAVMVDCSPITASEWMRASGARALQLCGRATPVEWRDFPYPVLRRISVEHGAQRELESWLGVARGFVLDHPSAHGGSGLGVDVELAASLSSLAPCLLSGGLDADCVAERIARVRPWGVDASSRLESAPGVKDPARVAAFVRSARAALAETIAPIASPSRSRAHTGLRFGDFGGAFAPETLMASLLELERAWLDARGDASFGRELDRLLATYAGRPTALSHARRLSAELGIDLWIKREDLLHTGAHKLNNTLGQCLLAQRMKKTRILAETGAGQHGVATATACALLGLECVVYMGAVDAARQRMNLVRMQLLGARVEIVEHGQKTLKDAINEAMRAWVSDPERSHYVLGSALGPHPFPSIVAGFQEVIGREARAQMLDQCGARPDVAVACVGGGSNAIGLFRAFVDDPRVKLVGVEAGGEGVEGTRHAARFAGGSPGVLHGCHTWILQDDDGQIRATHSISAGLDYPAVGPEHAELHARGRVRYEWCADEDALRGFELLARLEGILPALESAHALGWVARERESLRGQRVLVNLSGRGDKDLDAVCAARAMRERGSR